MNELTLKESGIDVDALVREVVKRITREGSAVAATQPPANRVSSGGGRDGVFGTVDEAVQAAWEAQIKFAERSLEDRAKIVEAIKRLCEEKADELGKMEYEEGHIGRMDHKAEKLKLVRRVAGVEALSTLARRDSSGIDLIAAAPFGVVGMVTPATHSVPTMAGNAINILAAGNTAVFSPHPAVSKCLAYALALFNREIFKLTGLSNLLCTVDKPSMESAGQIFRHEKVSLLCVTGGPGVVKAAMQCGKRVIAAGPGNPPVVVDETADLEKAARDIIAGASFDNNLLCIGEKEVFVVEPVFTAFMAAMEHAGAVRLNSSQIESLTAAAFTFEEGKGKGCGRAHVNRDFIGKDTSVLAKAAGLNLGRNVDLLFGETTAEHAFVQEEQMMPFLPIVKVRDFEAAVAAAKQAEHNYRHTAILHSKDLGRVTRMARILNTTLFVQNAACSASLGLDGPGYLSYSIATPTGEGVTTPLTFTRQRQCILGGSLNFA